MLSQVAGVATFDKPLGTVGSTGGSKDAGLIQHSHTEGVLSAGTTVRVNTDVTDGSADIPTFTGGSRTTSVEGTVASGTNANLPPYYALSFIILIQFYYLKISCSF
jgi:hypothetical protein